MRYPTEAKYGSEGYRTVRGVGLSTDPVPRTPKPIEPFRPPTPGGKPVRPPTFPANDPRPFGRVVSRRPPIGGLAGAGRLLGPVATGLTIGWQLGVWIFGDPFAPVPSVPDPNVIPEGWRNPRWQWNPCTLQCPRTAISYAGSTSAGLCVEGEIVPNCAGSTGHVIFPDPGPATPAAAVTAFPPATWIRVEGKHPTLAGKYQTVGNFQKLASGTNVWTQVLTPPPGVVVIPQVLPSTSPEALPITAPAIVLPPAWPGNSPEPGQEPSANPLTNPWVGSAVSPVPLTVLPPVVLVPPTVAPGASPGTVTPNPVVIPTVVITPNPNGGLDVTTQPGSNPTGRNPPPPGERNEKYYNAGPRGLRVAVNIATEAGDFINALYAGVRDLQEEKCFVYDYVCQLRAIYDNFDNPEFNAAEFIEAFINNQFEDWFYGTLGQYIGSASRNLNILTGLNRWLSEGQDNIYELLEMEGVDPVGLLPTLVHDQTNDTWFMEWELFGISVPVPSP